MPSPATRWHPTSFLVHQELGRAGMLLMTLMLMLLLRDEHAGVNPLDRECTRFCVKYRRC